MINQRRALLIPAFSLSLGACQEFDPPPKATVEGLENGVMSTQSDAPFVVKFSEPFVKSSLRLKLVKAVIDAEGDLLDEISPPDLEGFKANTLVAYDGGAAPDDDERNYGATFDLAGTTLTIDPQSTFSASTPHMLIIEPGLEDLEGHKTVPRVRLPFTFELGGGGPTTLPTGYYYFLLTPEILPVQIQVYTYMEVDPVTGQWRARFTNANRLVKLNSRPGCPASCPEPTTVCALVPSAQCVKPSDLQTDLEQYVDFLPEQEPPFGYFFITSGFAKDEPSKTTAFGTPPFQLAVTIGQAALLVEAENTRISAVFRKHDDERWRATGSLSVKLVRLDGKPLGPTPGTLQAMSLFDDEVKAVESFGFPIPTNLEQ